MSRHPYRRLRPAKSNLPEVGISEEGNIHSLHLGSDIIQSSMSLDYPAELVLSYNRTMMGWLLFVERTPKYITQISLDGGSFARWIDNYLPDTRQTAMDINPQVVAAACSLFKLPFEGGNFGIIEAGGAKYVKVFRHNINAMLVDGFNGEQIVDALVEEPFSRDCHHAPSPDGVFVTNQQNGDERYQHFVGRLLNVFEGRVLKLPAENHGNMVAMTSRSSPKEQNPNKLRKRAEKLSEQYGLNFKWMLNGLKANNPNSGKHFHL